ncbi:MAG: hypothetical protein FWE85_03480 [Clostridiales bacterium]|nr:hypothetical protein [Clostridiales bacterium]
MDFNFYVGLWLLVFLNIMFAICLGLSWFPNWFDKRNRIIEYFPFWEGTKNPAIFFAVWVIALFGNLVVYTMAGYIIMAKTGPLEGGEVVVCLLSFLLYLLIGNIVYTITKNLLHKKQSQKNN